MAPIFKPKIRYCPHLLLLSGNLSRLDPYITNSLHHLIQHPNVTRFVRRCSIFDLREHDYQTFVDRTCTHWSTMLLWDSTLPVISSVIESFQTFIKAKSDSIPVFVWVYVNPELVRNKKQRQRAIAELVKICEEKIFGPLLGKAVWKLEIFGLEKEGRKHFNRGLTWLKKQVRGSLSKEFGTKTAAVAKPSAVVHTSAKPASLHVPAQPTLQPQQAKLHASSSSASGHSSSHSDIFMRMHNPVPSKAKVPTSSPDTSAQLKKLRISLDTETQHLSRSHDAHTLSEDTRPTRDVQSLSETALQNAKPSNVHHPGIFTTDADRTALFRRRDIRRTVDAVEAEIARLFRNRRVDSNSTRSSRSVRFTNTVTNTASLNTLRSDLTDNTNSTFDDSSFSLIPNRRAEFAGGVTDVLRVPSWVPGSSMDIMGVDPGQTPSVTPWANPQQGMVNVPAVPDTVSSVVQPRPFSVQNVFRNGIRRAFVSFESAAEVPRRETDAHRLQI